MGNGVTSIGANAFLGCSGLKNLYYCGTSADWDNIGIGRINTSRLNSATIYYYSESQPTDEGNYWHYDTDGVTPVVW
jgi:hypothetical protein